jgi:iron complex outermembrane receptor protein
MLSVRRKTLLAAAVGGLLSMTSFAQEEQTMKMISVTADEDGYLSVVARGGTKTDAPLIEVPQAITVINAEQIKDQNAENLQEVLRYAPGVRAEAYGMDNRGDWFTLRGGSEGSALLDGLRVPLTGWWGLVRAEPYAFERIEILRGPSSVIAGQNGPGGTVNMVSKRPQATAKRELYVQGGNYSLREFGADFTGPLNESGTLLYRAVGLFSESDTQINLADQERRFLAPSVTWLPSESTSLTLFGEYQKDRSMNTNAFLPWVGTILPAPNGPVPTDLFIGEPDWDTYGGTRKRIGVALEQELNEQWTLRTQLRRDDVEGGMRNMYAAFYDYPPRDFLYGGGGRTIGRQWYASEDDSKITNGEVLLEGRFDTGALNHTVVMAVDGVRAEMSMQTDSGAATTLDVYAPVYGTFPLPTLNFGAPVVSETKQLGVLLQDQIKIDERYIIVASLRRDSSKSEERDNPLSKRNDSAWTKRLGFVYMPTDSIAPYISYSESFEPVANTSYVDAMSGDTVLVQYDPLRGKQIEAGVKYLPTDGTVAASAAVYRLKEKNRLSPNPINPSLPSVQGGEVTVEGVELETSLNLNTFKLTANYTYTNGKTTASSTPEQDSALGNKLTSVPKHGASLWGVNTFRFTGDSALRAGLGVRYVGETWDGTDELSVPSNTLIDALLAFDYDKWSVALNVVNVTDKDYIVTCLTRGDCWFGVRRKIAGTVSYRF